CFFSWGTDPTDAYYRNRAANFFRRGPFNEIEVRSSSAWQYEIQTERRKHHEEDHFSSGRGRAQRHDGVRGDRQRRRQGVGPWRPSPRRDERAPRPEAQPHRRAEGSDEGPAPQLQAGQPGVLPERASDAAGDEGRARGRRYREGRVAESHLPV